MQEDIPENIDCLIFSIMNVRFGADMTQISAICDPDDMRRYTGINLYRLDRMLAFPPVSGEIYRSPRILVIKGEGTQAGIMVDEPEDILPVSLNIIRPFPLLMHCLRPDNPVWAAALTKTGIILLLDFYRLLA